MPCSRFWVVSHWLCRPWLHIQQVPQEMLNGTTTRSPAFSSVTCGPTSWTTPIGSGPLTPPPAARGDPPRLVAHHVADRHERGHHLDQVEVRAADARRGHLDDDVGGVLDR